MSEFPPLSPAQIEQLLSVDLAVALPAWCPSGFQVVEVSTDREARWGDAWRVRLSRPSGGDLLIQGARAGFGDVPPGASSHAFHTSSLGSGTLEWYPPGSEEGVDFRTAWLMPEPEQEGFGISGRGLTLEEALQVASSLEPA